MPQPTISQVHVDRPLSNLSVGFIQEDRLFVHRRAFPVVTSPNRSNQYFTYARDNWLRNEALRRAEGTESAGSGWPLTTVSFSCEPDALHKDLDDLTRANADAPINLDLDATRFVTQKILLAAEVRWAAAYFATSVWNADTTPGTLWDNVASTPIEDVAARALVMKTNTGGQYKPNKFILGAQVASEIVNHPDLVDRIKYTQRGIVTADLLAPLFGVDEVLICEAARNTAAEGRTASYSFVAGGTNALLCYAAPSPGIMTPSAGFTFVWNGMGAPGEGMTIKRFRMEQIRSDRIEGEMWYNFGVVSTVLGEFFSAVVT